MQDVITCSRLKFHWFIHPVLAGWSENDNLNSSTYPHSQYMRVPPWVLIILQTLFVHLYFKNWPFYFIEPAARFLCCLLRLTFSLMAPTISCETISRTKKDRKSSKVFDKGFVYCNICLNDCPRKKTHQLNDCGCIFCKEVCCQTVF